MKKIYSSSLNRELLAHSKTEYKTKKEIKMEMLSTKFLLKQQILKMLLQIQTFLLQFMEQMVKLDFKNNLYKTSSKIILKEENWMNLKLKENMLVIFGELRW